MMKRFPLLILFTVFLVDSSAQKTWTGDTASFWYKYKDFEHKTIGLNEIVSSKNALTVRFSNGNEIIELWTSDYKEFKGQKIFFTKVNKLVNQHREYHDKKILIGPDTAKMLYNLMMEYNILSMPSQESIKGWREGINGTMYTLEISTSDKYSFNKYWSPSIQKNIREAVLITKFISKARTLLNQKKDLKKFFNSLPPNCYHYGVSTKCIK